MNEANPAILLVAGPNGAGKTTAAAKLLGGAVAAVPFVNADVIARELSPENPEGAAFEAGRRTLEQIDDLLSHRESFAFETTLSARTYAIWLRRAISLGYLVRISYFWLPSAEMAVERVSRRVAAGGHSIPADVIRRRYAAGLRNFFQLYRPLATVWDVYDNSEAHPRLVAEGSYGQTRAVADPADWLRIQGAAGF